MAISDVTWSCECGEVLKQPAERAGKEYQCPKCHQRGWVPVPKSAPPRIKPKTITKANEAVELDPDESIRRERKDRHRRLRAIARGAFVAADLVKVLGTFLTAGVVIAGGYVLLLPSHVDYRMPAAEKQAAAMQDSINNSMGASLLFGGLLTLLGCWVVASFLSCAGGILMAQLDVFESIRALKPPDAVGD